MKMNTRIDEHDRLYPPEWLRMKRADNFMLNNYDEKSDKTQCEYTLEYLEIYESITPLEALRAYGCLRLGARIGELRHAGYAITTEINPTGNKKYAIYRLKDGEEVAHGEDHIRETV